MEKTTLWVDADSCPVSVRDMIIRFAQRLKLHAVFAANRLIPLPRCDLLTMAVTEALPDSADNYIVQNSTDNDIVVTRDILLAERLLKKGVTVLNDRGVLYSTDSIRERLSLRNFNLHLYESGCAGERTDSFGKKELNTFANSLDRELHKKLRSH